MSPQPTATDDQSAEQAIDAIAFDADVEREAQLREAYSGEQFDQVLKFDESLLKAEWDAYNHKVKLLEPIYKQRSEFIRKIPGFWLKVLTNDPRCSSHIDPIDRDALAHLEDFTLEHDPKDARAVTLNFYFAKGNPYFSDRTLSKKFTVVTGQKPTTTNGSGPKPHPTLVAMSEKYELERGVESTPVAINWTSDEHNLVAKKPCVPTEELANTEAEIEGHGYGSFFNFFAFEKDEFELHSTLLEVHSKALDIYAGLIEHMEGSYAMMTDDEDDEEDDDPNVVVDLESDSNDEPKKKKAKVAP